MYFYEILQNIMKERSLSIPDVARMTGLSDSTIRSSIVNKYKGVSLEVAAKIAKGLNVDLDVLNGDKPITDTVVSNETTSITASEDLSMSSEVRAIARDIKDFNPSQMDILKSLIKTMQAQGREALRRNENT
jgi:transcriptional regulator with XRE-family HTH domain